MIKLSNSIHLKGIRDVNASSLPKVWLNHKLLQLNKSLKVKIYSFTGFNWGQHEKGAMQASDMITPFTYRAIDYTTPRGYTR